MSALQVGYLKGQIERLQGVIATFKAGLTAIAQTEPGESPAAKYMQYEAAAALRIAAEGDEAAMQAEREADEAQQGAATWERSRVCAAAAIASERFGQWVPQQWVDHFMKAYEAAEPK